MWKKKNFFTETSTNIRIKRSKWENILIKDNISRNIDTTSGHIKAFNSFMTRTISKENTPFRSEREFMLVIWTKVGPASTTKDT